MCGMLLAEMLQTPNLSCHRYLHSLTTCILPNGFHFWMVFFIICLFRMSWNKTESSLLGPADLVTLHSTGICLLVLSLLRMNCSYQSVTICLWCLFPTFSSMAIVYWKNFHDISLMIFLLHFSTCINTDIILAVLNLTDTIPFLLCINSIVAIGKESTQWIFSLGIIFKTKIFQINEKNFPSISQILYQ